MKNKFAIFSATRGKSETTQLHKSLVPILEKNPNVSLHFRSENRQGLSKTYNAFLKNNLDKYDVIIFIHDDVFIDDLKIFEKLDEAHTRFDIVGLAGGINPVMKEPALWHLMCGGFASGNLRGSVAHPYNKETITVTCFGPSPSRAVILDGLFLSVKTKEVKKVDWKFNETFNFHHYDIASCIDANFKRLKLGVWPIWVIHSSPGLSDPKNTEFLISQTKFLRDYAR